MSFCPSNTKIIVQTTLGRLIVFQITNYQFNLLALKRMIEDKEFIQIDQQEISFCKEEMTNNYQGIDMYHRYFHQKYGKCMYMSSIQLKLKL